MGHALHRRDILTSPVPRLLRCNDPPTPDEVVQIREQIKLVEAEFEALAGRPYRKGQRKYHVVPQAHKHLFFLDQHHDIVVGHRFLPAEILEQIFYFTFHLDDTWSQHASLRSLTHVCRRWRLAAISSPRLWTHLPRIEVRSHHTAKVESNRLQKLKVYLHRSRDHPISFIFVNNIKPKKEARVLETLDFLSNYCHRWAEVSLTIDMKYAHTLDRVRGELPNLRSLQLDVTSSSLQADRIFDAFATAPSLRHVFLQRSDHGSGLIFSLPWAQLDTYKEQSNSELGFGDVINASANISSIDCTTTQLDIPVFKPVTHQKLTKLHLRIFSVPNSSLSLFDKLYLPSLSDLLFHSRCNVVPLEGILSLLTRSGCSLKALSLTGCGPGSQTLPAILSLFPELERLSVDYITRPTLLRLTFNSNNADVLVPHLRELTVHHLYYPMALGNDAETVLDGPAMTAMARSRIDNDEAHQDNLPPLKVSMTFQHESVCERQLEVLEGFSASLRILPAMDEMIQRWHAVLSQELTYWRPRFSKLKPSYYRIPGQLNRTFKEMESYPIAGSDPTVLLKARIPALLHKAASMSAGYIPGHAIYHFKERARDLCERWKPFFILDTRLRRWTYRGRLALEYVPANDARREGENAWKTAIEFSDQPLTRDYAWNS